MLLPAAHAAVRAERTGKEVVETRPPMPYPGAVAAIGRAAVDKYEREEGQVALAVAEKELMAAGIPYRSSWYTGDIAAELAIYVKKYGIGLVVVGSHGQSALANLALGSVATKCIATLDVPIMIVRRDLPQKPIEKSATTAAKVPANAKP
jgi:nucleotide-binding universal stress UspA family protein